MSCILSKTNCQSCSRPLKDVGANLSRTRMSHQDDFLYLIKNKNNDPEWIEPNFSWQLILQSINYSPAFVNCFVGTVPACAARVSIMCQIMIILNFGNCFHSFVTLKLMTNQVTIFGCFLVIISICPMTFKFANHWSCFPYTHSTRVISSQIYHLTVDYWSQSK